MFDGELVVWVAGNNNVVHLVAYQRGRRWFCVNRRPSQRRCSVERRFYDDTLIAKAAGGVNLIIIAIPEVKTPRGN